MTPADGGVAYVEVTGLSHGALDDLEDAQLDADDWSALLRVAVDDDSPAMLGKYSVTETTLRFTPAFPFDPGRQYHVRFDPARLPTTESEEPGGPLIVTTVGRPAAATVPTTVVARVYPTGDVVPENLLRMYVEFSAPMGRKSGIEYLQLLDDRGAVVQGAFLPLDYEFWSPDHTRFTVFFDPGRVKRGILPNQQAGRALMPGHTYTLVVGREWRDANGLPLKDEYRRTLRIGPADERPLDIGGWKIQPPKSATRDPLVVVFPEPLDHGLLLRALGVRSGTTAVDGDIVTEAGETRWLFTPREPWRAGAHQLLALDILEDLAGNQIGRAFEVDNFDTVDKGPNPQTITLPFSIK
jgi:hypothetical protein